MNIKNNMEDNIWMDNEYKKQYGGQYLNDQWI